MATEIDKLLEGLRLLSTDDMRRLRQAIDEELAESHTAVATNGSERLQALSRLRKELAALPVHNPSDGQANRDHDELLYGDDDFFDQHFHQFGSVGVVP